MGFSVEPRPVSHSAQNSRAPWLLCPPRPGRRAPPQSLRSWERCSGPRGGALSLPCPQGPPGPRPAAQPLLLASTHPKPPKPPRPPASAPAHPPPPPPPVPALIWGSVLGAALHLHPRCPDSSLGSPRMRGGGACRPRPLLTPPRVPVAAPRSPAIPRVQLSRHAGDTTAPSLHRGPRTQVGLDVAPGRGCGHVRAACPARPPTSPWGTA